jgi:hypothetical protein
MGFSAVEYAARLPGSAIIMPIPTWLQIGAYYVVLVLLFVPRRTYLTWAGTGLAAGVLAASVTLPAAHHPKALELTCLDTYRGLAGVVVTPENHRLALSAVGPSWPGRSAGGIGPLPAYCHWRQFRSLDQVAALCLSRDNASELLSLSRQFQVGQIWYGRRGPEGPASWELWNFLGDQGRPARSLEKGRPPSTLGSVDLKYLTLGQERGVALELAYEGRRLLVIPPLRQLQAEDLPVTAGLPLEVLVLPAELSGSQGLHRLLSQLKPKRVVVYGGFRANAAASLPGEIPALFTGEGAVSLYLSAAGVKVKQWRP